MQYFNYLETTSDKDLITFFLDWRENYATNNLSINEFASDYGLSVKEAKELMLAGSKLHTEQKLTLMG